MINVCMLAHTSVQNAKKKKKKKKTNAAQAAADDGRPVPQPLLELAAAAQLLLLAWRLDAAEQRAPGAAAPAPLGALAGRFAEQLDRLGEAAGGGGAASGGAAAGRALLLVQADLLLLFSAGKLRARADADVSDRAGRSPCIVYEWS